MTQALALIVVAGALIFGLIWLNESQTAKIRAEAQAQATLMRAESDARFKDAQTTAIMMAATLPLVIVVSASVVGSIVAVAVVIMAIKYQPKQVIERRVVFQIEAGPRRELWQAMANNRGEIFNLTEGQDDEKTLVLK